MKKAIELFNLGMTMVLVLCGTVLGNEENAETSTQQITPFFKNMPAGVVVDLRTGKPRFDLPTPQLAKENTVNNPIPATYLQKLEKDSSNSTTVNLTGNNPNGNGSYYRSGTEVRYVGNPVHDQYAWVVYVRGGYLRYRMFYDNIHPYSSAACTTRWRIHGTTSGGIPRTMWWVGFNGLYYAHPSPMPGDVWQEWYWPIDQASWQWDDHNDTLRVGIQDTSYTVMWIRYEYGKTNNVYITGVEEDAGKGASLRVSAPLFKVNPNPLSRTAFLTLNSRTDAKAKVAIFNISGHLVGSLEMPANRPALWDARGTDGRKLPAGIYFLRVTAGDYTETEKVVVTR